MIENLSVGTKLLCSRHYYMLRGCGRIHKKVFTKGRAYRVNSVKYGFITTINDDKIEHVIYEKNLLTYFRQI